jgi:hypothetical protein
MIYKNTKKLKEVGSRSPERIAAISFFDVLERKDNLRLDDFRFPIEFFD